MHDERLSEGRYERSTEKVGGPLGRSESQGSKYLYGETGAKYMA